MKELTISDPSRTLSRMQMTISGHIDAKHSDNLMAVFDSKSKTSELTIDLPTGFYAGQSVVIQL